MIDLRRLALLRELHHRGTIAAVAAALSYSSSSVSQQLSQLEREVGVPLLVKSGRRVRLTPAAELLVTHTGDVLERMEALEAALAATGDAVAGTVRLAVFQSAALGIVPQALTLFAERVPRAAGRDHPARTRERARRGLGARVRPGDRRAVPRARGAPTRGTRPRAAVRRRDPARCSGCRGRLGRGRRAIARGSWNRAAPHPGTGPSRCAGSPGSSPTCGSRPPTCRRTSGSSSRGTPSRCCPTWSGAAGRRRVRTVDLPGAPRREVFTSARRAGARRDDRRVPPVLAAPSTRSGWPSPPAADGVATVSHRTSEAGCDSKRSGTDGRYP